MGLVRTGYAWLWLGVLVAAGCGAGAPTATPADASITPSSRPPSPTATATPRVSASTRGPSPSTDLSPGAFGYPHDDPDLEATLPEFVAGRLLTRWSAGPETLGLIGSATGEGNVLEELKPVLASLDKEPEDLTVAVAGRESPDDPPFIVIAYKVAGAEPERLGQALRAETGPIGQLFWSERVIAGRKVFIGTEGMIEQDEHIQGAPYLYVHGDVAYFVAAADPAWADEAISKLPPWE